MAALAALAPLAASLSSAAAAASPYIAAASAAMGIVGAASSSAAQRQAGEVAYQNAVMRKQAAETTARQQEIAAGQEAAAGQRKQQVALTRGQMLASRMRAVMGASGAGYDPNLIADLEGEGRYAADVAGFDASERARALQNQAALTRWSGDAGVWSGEADRAARNRAATNTLVGGVGTNLLSFASRYGLPGGEPNTTSVGTGDALLQTGDRAARLATADRAPTIV